MEKIEISKNFFIPMPVVLVGTQVNGRANFMAVGWCARVSGTPPMIACGISNTHATPSGIMAAKTFSVNLPSSALIEKTDYCGIVSGKTVDKSGVFDLFYGTLKTAPMIRECPVTLECSLVQAVALPTHTLFIGEIAGAWADSSAINDNKPDFPAIDPLILTIPDNRYWKLGDHAGDAWGAGKALVKTQKTTP